MTINQYLEGNQSLCDLIDELTNQPGQSGTHNKEPMKNLKELDKVRSKLAAASNLLVFLKEKDGRIDEAWKLIKESHDLIKQIVIDNDHESP